MTTTRSDQQIALSLTVNAALAATKLWAAMITGSSSLFAEALRSLTDVSEQGLMIAGLSRTAPGDRHRDTVFWTFVVAILLYGLAAGIATYEAIDRLNRPRPIDDERLAYCILAAALIVQAGLAWAVARTPATTEIDIALRIQSSAGVLGTAVALIGTAAGDVGQIQAADALAAICVALLLALTAAVMAFEVKTRLAALPRQALATSGSALLPDVPTPSPPKPATTTATATPPHPHGTRKRKGKRRRR